MKERSQREQLAIVILLLAGAAAAYLALSPKAHDTKAAEAVPAPAVEAVTSEPVPPACATEEQCAVERVKDRAEGTCRQAVAARAKYDLRWDDSGRPLFIRGGWADKARTDVTFAGDAVSFQNGFGAYEHMVYLCTVDTATAALKGLEIAPGRLPAPP